MISRTRALALSACVSIIVLGCSEKPVGVGNFADGITSASSRHNPSETGYLDRTILQVTKGYNNKFYIFNMYNMYTGNSPTISYKRATTSQHSTPELTWPETWLELEPNPGQEQYPISTQLAVAKHYDGKMFVFSTNSTNNRPVFRMETAAGSDSWTDWTQISSNQIGRIYCDTTHYGNVVLFGYDLATGKVRYFRRRSGGGWENVLLGDRAVAYSSTWAVVKKGTGSNSRLMVVIYEQSTSSQLYQITQNGDGSWPSNYQALSNSICWYPDPTMKLQGITDHNNRLNLFLPCVCTFKLRTCRQNDNGTWTDWQDVTDEWIGSYAVALDAQASPKRIVVAYKGSNSFACRRQTSNLSGWVSQSISGNPNPDYESLSLLQLEGITWPDGHISFLANMSTTGKLSCLPPLASFYDTWILYGAYNSLTTGWKLCGGPYSCFEY